MNKQEIIRSIVDKLKTVQWSWSKREVQSIVSSIATSMGYSLDEKRKNRISYGSVDTVDFTMYFSGEHVEWVEITLEAYLVMDELTLEERETKVDEYIRKYQKVV